jgi:nucleoside 2-deoxyribosyltransferase
MKKMVFIICSVRGMSDSYRFKLEKYVTKLESSGYIVHLPHRDTDQSATGIEICTQNMNAIKMSDEVHIFYSSESKGTHFDMGMAFALGKPMVVFENEPIIDDGKSFHRTLIEWENKIYV